MSSSTSTITNPSTSLLMQVPREVQVHLLTYLRAYDLSSVQQTCKFLSDPDLIHEVVTYTAEHVYSKELTKDVVKCDKYTLEHLRTIELTVVARVLSLPEPKTGYYVSKSWVKKTLLWLEKVNEQPAPPKKKLSKKQQRQKARRLSDISPPWPNVNSDILCCHQQLARCSAKSARARRKLMDKKAWKILNRLYPDSTQLEHESGECLQCLLETETARKSENDRLEQEKVERKKPLANSKVRHFYTRTRGVPIESLVQQDNATPGICPLRAGTYVVIPRAWCHQWRRFIKIGEGGMPLPPESSALLCDAHKLALLPPHLEAYLNGEIPQLLSTTKPSMPPAAASANDSSAPMSPISSPRLRVPVGAQPVFDIATINALMAAGFSEVEMASQQMAMLQLEQQDQHPELATHTTTAAHRESTNELLDVENHVVVELVSHEEWLALQETGCWPKQLSHYCISVVVEDSAAGKFQVSTQPCRECDPTGSRFKRQAQVQYRRKRWEPKSVEQRRTSASVEY